MTVVPSTTYQQLKTQPSLKSTGKILMDPCNYKIIIIIIIELYLPTVLFHYKIKNYLQGRK